MVMNCGLCAMSAAGGWVHRGWWVGMRMRRRFFFFAAIFGRCFSIFWTCMFGCPGGGQLEVGAALLVVLCASTSCLASSSPSLPYFFLACVACPALLLSRVCCTLCAPCGALSCSVPGWILGLCQQTCGRVCRWVCAFAPQRTVTPRHATGVQYVCFFGTRRPTQ